MNTKIQKTALLSILLAATGFIQSIQAENTAISFSAQALSSEECLSTFYRNIHKDRIFPVRICIKNNTEKAVTLCPEDIIIESARLLTPKKFESSISSKILAEAFVALILIPLIFLVPFTATELKKIQPIFNSLSFPDGSTTIQPGQTLETMLFTEFDYPKNIDGKSQKFVAPQALDITLTLESTIYLLFKSKTVLSINVPIS